MKKPRYLYHASPVRNLSQIEPRAKTIPSDFQEGQVVFATDEFAFATQFLVPSDDSWANGGAMGDVLFFIVSDKERFHNADKGGSIYLITSQGFTNYNKREWFAKKPKKTESEIYFPKGFLAMLTQNVQVYFVDKTLYSKIQEYPQTNLHLLNSIKSENEKRGQKVVQFDFYKGSKKLAENEQSNVQLF